MSAASERPVCILVIDDEPANVMLLQRLLGRVADWTVEGVTRSADAADRFAELRPDLVLLDLHMPPPDGFALLQELRSRLGESEYLPIIVLTADVTRESRERALELGASDFLVKPLDAVEVVLRVRNLLETRALHRRVAGENERLEALVQERTRALAEALEAAEAANRAKDQFLANVSHELRTPLTAVRGAVGLLAGPLLQEPAKARKLVETAARNTDRLQRLIQDVLLLQSLQSGAVTPSEAEVDLGDVVGAVVRAVSCAPAPGQVELRAVVPDPLQPIRTDAAMLEQVLQRLVDNALRFTQHGAVTVEVRRDPATARPLGLRVADTGPGIPRERHEAIFLPFEQEDNSDTRRHGGLGVGLTIARSICELLGFGIRVESAPGGGSCFTVDFAAIPSPRAAGGTSTSGGFSDQGSNG